MWSALRSRSLSSAVQPRKHQLQPQLSRSLCSSSAVERPPHDGSHSNSIRSRTEVLHLEEVEKILSDVKADDVRVIPFLNTIISLIIWSSPPAALLGTSGTLLKHSFTRQVKQNQKGAKRKLLPSVEGQEGGKWIVIDSGALIIHALDEKVRTYYNLEKLWSSGTTNNEQAQELEKAFVKIRRKNNSKKPSQTSARIMDAACSSKQVLEILVRP